MSCPACMNASGLCETCEQAEQGRPTGFSIAIGYTYSARNAEVDEQGRVVCIPAKLAHPVERKRINGRDVYRIVSDWIFGKKE